MLFDLSIIPVGDNIHTRDEIAKALVVIEASGLPYQLTPSGPCIEGEWAQVMPVIKKCHDEIRQSSLHLITTIKIEDDAGEEDKRSQRVASNVASVVRKTRHSGRHGVLSEE